MRQFKSANLVTLITGQTFGRLLAIAYLGHKKWLCKCECGTVARINGKRLRGGQTKSCGCLFLEIVRGSRGGKHGEASGSRTPEYRAYCAAKSCCESPTNENYPRYGGRGIEFRFSSFDEFLAEVGRRPSDDLSIDRIDNNGHYEVGNLRWATRSQQARNQRRENMRPPRRGISDLRRRAEELNLSVDMVRFRKRTGWCDTCIFTLPKNIGRKGCLHR